MAATEKESSRLQTLIDENYARLDTRRKALMDAVKILARNLFYHTLRPFRQLCENYRDDHAVLRNLTHAHGWVTFGQTTVTVSLLPAKQYPPHLRRTITAFLEHINHSHPPMPNGSRRTIRFQLAKEAGKLSAIDTVRFPVIH